MYAYVRVYTGTYTCTWFRVGVRVLGAERSESGVHAMANATNNTSEDDDPTFGCSPYSELNRSGITDSDQWTIKSDLQQLRFLIAAIELAFCLLAISWNVFIVVTMVAKRRMLREPANIYLLNLAVADLLLAIVVLPFTVVAELANEFVFGSSDYSRCIVCNFAGVTLQVLSAATLHIIAALSFDRFFILSYPLRYKRYMTWGKALLISFGIWFISLWIGLPPLLGFGQYTFNRAFANCHPVWEGDDFNYVRFVLFESFLPIAVLIVANIWTYRLASLFLKKRLRRRTTIRQEEGPEQLKEEHKMYQTKQRRLTQTFTVLLLVYLVTWTPSVVIAIVANFISAPGSLEVAVFGWICYITNPVFHPIIETFFIKELREEVAKVKRCMGNTWRRLFCGRDVCGSGKSDEEDTAGNVLGDRPCSCIAGEGSNDSTTITSDTCSTPQGNDKLLHENLDNKRTTSSHTNTEKFVLSMDNIMFDKHNYEATTV